MAFTARNESILSLKKYIDMNIDDKITNINKALTEMKTTLDTVAHAMTHIGIDDMKDDHRSKNRIDNELRYNNHITFITEKKESLARLNEWISNANSRSEQIEQERIASANPILKEQEQDRLDKSVKR